MTTAILSGTAEMRGALPHDLSEMAPLLEERHGWIGFTIETVVVADLTVVEEVGNDRGDVVGLYTSSDVLTVPATVDVA